MLTDAEIFAEWLNPSKVTTTTRRGRTRKQPVTLNAELAKPMGIVGGLTPGGKGNNKRTGYIGARLSAPEVTGDCVVTTRAGDRYTLKRNRTHRTELTKAELEALVDLQNKAMRHHKVTCADLPAIGNQD